MSAKLRAGDLVEVRSKEEILATLDSKGLLRGMPFMPEMFQHCGKRARVYKRAHKTCDTVNQTGGRWVGDAVHLESLRCGGESHGGCQAACLLFWCNEWLKRVPESGSAPQPNSYQAVTLEGKAPKCSEQDVAAATVTSMPGAAEAVYSCQATLLPQYTEPLPWWDFRQYWEDYRSGNVGLWRLFCGGTYAMVSRVNRARYGRHLHIPFFYDKFQALFGGTGFPRRRGNVPADQKTPSSSLGLKPGDLVRVKAYRDILNTISQNGNKNKGMFFDAEMVPYCGQTHRVMQRVSRIIDEKTGKMLEFKSDSVMLENVCCQSRYSDKRMFCPRAIYSMWKEVWLERAEDKPAGSQ
jgi:hypothetical protein